MEFVNNLLKKVNKIDIPRNSIFDSTDLVNQNFRHDFINSKNVIILDEDIIVSYIHKTNGIVYLIIFRNNSQASNLVKAIENKINCAEVIVIYDYVPINLIL
uniref:Transposase n=1 Tax=Strongyloides venezuelensis TaxID=75913 RepID=A0A0K0FEZ0_STRVS